MSKKRALRNRTVAAPAKPKAPARKAPAKKAPAKTTRKKTTKSE